MLKSIEMWDFESHKHTLIDDLSEGLNLICGESNAGKTSIVRALKLVAYNEFDPDSIRVGAKKCKVRVTSDKGVVQVTRGPKDNFWEITENGQPTKELDKVGVNIVPDAARIVGLDIVRLGDVDVPVNIMDQLESHFMLSGIGNEKASGSVRAQIIDEISGLSGIEGVIKEVSLDNHRFGREVKQLEDDVKKTLSELHDKEQLEKEGETLDAADTHLKQHGECLMAVSAAEDVAGDFESVSGQVGTKSAALASIPDVDRATSLLADAEEASQLIEVASSMHTDHVTIQQSLVVKSDALDSIGDIQQADRRLTTATNADDRRAKAQALLSQHASIKKQQKSLDAEVSRLERAQKAVGMIDSIDATLKKLQAVGKLWGEHEGKVVCHLDVLTDKMNTTVKQLQDAEKHRDEILESITVCPINLGPVSKECLKDVGSHQ